MVKNIYGLSAKQFRLLKAQYDGLSDGNPEKQKMMETEKKVVDNIKEMFGNGIMLKSRKEEVVWNGK